MRIQRSVVILLLVFYLCTFVGGIVNAAENDAAILTLHDCLEFVLRDHPKLKVAQFQVHDAKLELQKILLDDPRWVAELDLKRKKEAVSLAEQEFHEIQMQLCLQVEEGYYSVLRASSTVQSKERAVEWNQRQQKIVEVKYAGGLVPEKEVQLMKDRLETVLHDLDVARFHLDTAKMQFNITMGWELERKWELQLEELPFKLLTMGLEDALQYAGEHAPTITAAVQALKTAEENLNIKKASGASLIEVQKAEHMVFEARYKLEEAKKGIVITVRNAYIGIQSSLDGVTRAEKQYKTLAKEVDVLKIKYEAGMIALLDLMEMYNEYIDAENKWGEAIYAYSIAKSAFHRAIGQEYSLYHLMED